MVMCPVCLGEGGHDFGDLDDALEALAVALHISLPPKLGQQLCPACEGSGEITEDEYKDLHAAAVATSDQFFAAVRDGKILLDGD